MPYATMMKPGESLTVRDVTFVFKNNAGSRAVVVVLVDKDVKITKNKHTDAGTASIPGR